MVYDISTRISIRWLPDPPSEPTDTLVFNVGSYFIDLRILKSDKSIEWAMAGEKEVLSTSPLKCRWNKALDSRAPSAPDEGTFSKLPNGDDLEKGSMPCPEKGGQVTEYEEVWRDVPAPVGGKSAWILKSMPDGKIWLGRIGGVFLVVSEGAKDFGARREEWDDGQGTWKGKYATGELDGAPSLLGSGLEFDGEKAWKVGETVELQGRQYAVLAVEDL